MNDRLTELYRSCRPKEALASQDQFGSANALLGSEVEKFAELIVAECISTVENLSPGYQDYRNQIEDAFRRDCVEQIKQHFGVK